jgi:TetR/AcrR family transcriptional regulator, lmrAB and yxaGH operons repressor
MATDTRIRMIETTARLLRARGYHGTALGDVLAESGAPRGSLYFHFPGGKDELVAAATRQSVDAITEELRDMLLAERSTSKAVRRFMEAAAAALDETDFQFGSPVAPIVLDAPDAATAIAAISREAYETWIELLKKAFARSGVAPRRAQALALLVQSSFEGLLLICRACRSSEPMFTAARELETLLGTAKSRSGK